MHVRMIRLGATSVVAMVGVGVVLSQAQATGQKADAAQKLQEIKQASAANKAALAHYTWQEQQTVSLRGEVRKTTISQVRIGPGGQQQKTEISVSPAAGAGSGGGRFKQRIVAKKIEEFKEYGEQIAALAKQYTQLDPQALQQAYQKGNISVQVGGGARTTSLVVKNYLKAGDSMTLVFNTQAQAMETINVMSYLTDPGDAVTLAVQFARLPSGVNHVASLQMNGVSKQMQVLVQNANYQSTQM